VLGRLPVLGIDLHVQDRRNVLVRRRRERRRGRGRGRRRWLGDREQRRSGASQRRHIRLPDEEHLQFHVRDGLHDRLLRPVDLHGELLFELHVVVQRHEHLQPVDGHEQYRHLRRRE
jgi:hypothetical protein